MATEAQHAYQVYFAMGRRDATYVEVRDLLLARNGGDAAKGHTHTGTLTVQALTAKQQDIDKELASIIGSDYKTSIPALAPDNRQKALDLAQFWIDIAILLKKRTESAIVEINKTYPAARREMIRRIGQYCSYCELPSQSRD